MNSVYPRNLVKMSSLAKVKKFQRTKTCSPTNLKELGMIEFSKLKRSMRISEIRSVQLSRRTSKLLTMYKKVQLERNSSVISGIFIHTKELKNKCIYTYKPKENQDLFRRNIYLLQRPGISSILMSSMKLKIHRMSKTKNKKQTKVYLPI